MCAQTGDPEIALKPIDERAGLPIDTGQQPADYSVHRHGVFGHDAVVDDVSAPPIKPNMRAEIEARPIVTNGRQRRGLRMDWRARDGEIGCARRRR